jgi:hypothetical protein
LTDVSNILKRGVSALRTVVERATESVLSMDAAIELATGKRVYVLRMVLKRKNAR